METRYPKFLCDLIKKDDMTALKGTKIEKDVDHRFGWNDSTALMIAASFNASKVVRHLLDLGANAMEKNQQGSNAFMIAAEEGHIGIMEAIAENLDKKEGISEWLSNSNDYKQTALILAAEKNQLCAFKWIANRDPSQLEIKNKYGKNALIVSCEFGLASIAHWIIKHKGGDANEKRGDITALMFAAGGGTKDHSEIVQLLLENGADFKAKTKSGDTALIRAVMAGNSRAVDFLLRKSKVGECLSSINDKDSKGCTPLMIAAENGYYDVVQLLIKYEAKKWLVDFKGFNALTIALLQCHFKIAAEFLMVDGCYDMLSEDALAYLGADRLDQILRGLSNATNHGSTVELCELAELAAQHDFFFGLFIYLLPRFERITVVVHKSLPVFFKVLGFMERAKDIDIMDKLVCLAASLSVALTWHPLAKIDLQLHLGELDRMIHSCSAASCMDDDATIENILCRSRSEVPRLEQFLDERVERAQAFVQGPLATAICHQCMALFSSGRISVYIGTMLWGILRRNDRELHLLRRNFDAVNKRFHSLFMIAFEFFIACLKNDEDDEKRPNGIVSKVVFSKSSESIRFFKSDYLFLRFCPAALFFGEGISKLAHLGITCRLVAVVYRTGKELGVVSSGTFLGLLPIEHLLIVWTVAACLYELGQLCGRQISLVPSVENLRNYICDVWNCLDMVSLGLQLSWFALRVTGATEMSYGPLAISAVFLSGSMLRYIAVRESLGTLVIMVFAMLPDLLSVLFLILVCMFGFGVFFWGLFSDSPTFSTSFNTFLNMFSAMLNNYDDTFSSFDGSYSTLGKFIQVLYICVSSIVLNNLVIARMSATHDRIQNRSFQEWQFTIAQTVQQYSLTEEHNPLMMLPPPLNLLLVSFYPIHAFCLKTTTNKVAISVCGTISDKLVGIVMAFIAPWLEMAHYFTISDSRRRDLEFIEKFTLALLFPIIYIPYVAVLIYEALTLSTRVEIDKDGSRTKYKMEFPRRQHVTPTRADLNEDILTIRVIRASKVSWNEKSNILIKFRLGEFESVTQPGVFKEGSGNFPRGFEWSRQSGVVELPLQMRSLMKAYQQADGNGIEMNLFSVIVVDRDQYSDAETVVGRFSDKEGQIRTWIANKRFEGYVFLDCDGEVPNEDKERLQLVVKAEFPNLLQPGSTDDDDAATAPVAKVFVVPADSTTCIFEQAGRRRRRIRSAKDDLLSRSVKDNGHGQSARISPEIESSKMGHMKRAKSIFVRNTSDKLVIDESKPPAWFRKRIEATSKTQNYDACDDKKFSQINAVRLRNLTVDDVFELVSKLKLNNMAESLRRRSVDGQRLLKFNAVVDVLEFTENVSRGDAKVLLAELNRIKATRCPGKIYTEQEREAIFALASTAAVDNILSQSSNQLDTDYAATTGTSTSQTLCPICHEESVELRFDSMHQDQPGVEYDRSAETGGLSKRVPERPLSKIPLTIGGESTPTLPVSDSVAMVAATEELVSPLAAGGSAVPPVADRASQKKKNRVVVKRQLGPVIVPADSAMARQMTQPHTISPGGPG